MCRSAVAAVWRRSGLRRAQPQRRRAGVRDLAVQGDFTIRSRTGGPSRDREAMARRRALVERVEDQNAILARAPHGAFSHSGRGARSRIALALGTVRRQHLDRKSEIVVVEIRGIEPSESHTLPSPLLRLTPKIDDDADPAARPGRDAHPCPDPRLERRASARLHRERAGSVALLYPGRGLMVEFAWSIGPVTLRDGEAADALVHASRVFTRRSREARASSLWK